MSYEINDNRYKAEKRLEAVDVFNRDQLVIDSETEIDSVLASWVIVDESDRELFQGLTIQESIDLKVELGYISLVI